MMHSVAPVYRQLFEDNVDKFLINNPEAYYAMSSLANITGLPLWQTLLVNSIVDITSFCTSIVSRTTNGSIIHGRNLDFDFPSVLQSITYRAYIQINGKIVGEGICHAGYVGLYTAVRYDAFTVSYDVRMLGHTNTSEIIANIEREWETGVVPAAQAIQSAVLYNASFVAAVDYLSVQHINTPCYIILGGTNSGAAVSSASNDNSSDSSSKSNSNSNGVTLTRDPYSLNHTQWLDDPASGSSNWYIVQTNEDWWSVPDERYNTTTGYLDGLGQKNVNPVTIVTEVLNRTGVVQWITIYSASMSAEAGVADVYFTPLV